MNANVANEKDAISVLVCSAFIESDYEPMPTDRNGENPLFSQVSYYPLNAPVTLLPMDLNDETMKVVSQTVLAAAQKGQRFLLVAGPTSYPTAEWIANYARGAFTAHVLKEFNQAIMVVEFRPVTQPD